MRDAPVMRRMLVAFGMLCAGCKPTAPAAAPAVAPPVTGASAVAADTLTHAAWSRNAVIYEVNVRQFTPEGTLAGVRAHLPRLKALGVDVIWLMPVQPIG